MSNFWIKLKKPFFVLAPMANVTDAAFRYIIAKYSRYAHKNLGEYGTQTKESLGSTSGNLGAMWTEFVSADGLFYKSKITPVDTVCRQPVSTGVVGFSANHPLMRDLLFTESERPIVAQFFTSKPEKMEKASRLALDLGFDGVDINMGCPDKSIEKQGAGASLCKNIPLAKEIIRSAKKGVNNKIPVSVKIRLGYNTDILEEWLPSLLLEDPAVVTIHARTRKEMSKVPAHWDRIKKAVEIRDELKSKSLIIGNGDVLDLDDARIKARSTGCDGVMLGKAIFGNPWLFADSPKVSVKQKLNVLIEHTKLFEKLLGDIKSFAIMKKHFKAYVNGWDGAKELRMKLMETKNGKDVEGILKSYPQYLLE